MFILLPNLQVEIVRSIKNLKWLRRNSKLMSSIWTKVLWTVMQYSQLFFYFLAHPFSTFLAVLSPPPPPPPPPILYNIETWLYASNLVCGVGGDGHAELKNAPQMLMCPKTFAHHCRCQCQVNYIVCNVRI